jgi:hypothetical protein
MAAGRLAAIHTPLQGNPHVEGAEWCADNGCYGKGFPGEERWMRWLEARAASVESCAFATALDVVANAEATWERSRPWFGPIRSLGYPAALVAQDGFDPWRTDWGAFDVLFLGGSTEWKLGPAAAKAAAVALAEGKPVHMGRVNSLKRMKYAHEIGCASVDGTFLVFGPDVNLPKLLRWLDIVNAAPTLNLEHVSNCDLGSLSRGRLKVLVPPIGLATVRVAPPPSLLVTQCV